MIRINSLVLFLITFLFMAILIILPFFSYQKFIKNSMNKGNKIIKIITYIVIPEIVVIMIGIAIAIAIIIDILNSYSQM